MGHAVMTEQIAAVHFPQCPTCGLPMHVARISPVVNAEGRSADTYNYECAQGHGLTKIIERKD